MTALDLRPSEDSIIYHLLRLGLVFDHSEEQAQVWFNYAKSLKAVIESVEATSVEFTDMASRLSKTVTLEELKKYDRIITWNTADSDDSSGVSAL